MQRFFGACRRDYGSEHRRRKARGRVRDHHDADQPVQRRESRHQVRSSNVVAWPGYDQLTAQLAAGDPPDLVTMHELGDLRTIESRGLLEPIEADLARGRDRPRRSFTDASRAAASPWTARSTACRSTRWAPLWHINMNLFRQAGLVRTASRSCRQSPEELLAQARAVQGGAPASPISSRARPTIRRVHAQPLHLPDAAGRAASSPIRSGIQLADARSARACSSCSRQIYDERPHHQEPGLRGGDHRLHQRRGRRLSRRAPG